VFYCAHVEEDDDAIQVPELIRKLALWYEKHFHFAVFFNPSKRERDVLHVGKMPELQMLVQRDADDHSAKPYYAIVKYERSDFGPLKFKNLVRLRHSPSHPSHISPLLLFLLAGFSISPRRSLSKN
jgi:hypothetical protein